MIMTKVAANRILRKWKSDLVDKDRSWNNIDSNFDELFYELHMSSVDIDIAEPMIKEAAAAHMPAASLAKRVYATGPKLKGIPYDEFLKGWRDGINNKAEQAFFVYYQVSDHKEERQLGSMSPKEYAAQRAHVASFGEVDFTKLLEDQERILEEAGDLDGEDT
jgi:hypothetical protein